MEAIFFKINHIIFPKTIIETETLKNQNNKGKYLSLVLVEKIDM